jgi:response regulator RpfG family c-di-GMP phosphodiesterase
VNKTRHKILLVDDDANLLAAFGRRFREKYDIETAERGSAGLRTLADRGPFAVVVSDMRMPEMNGIQFLRKVNEISPETVRIMLTGNADLDTAVHAVNNSNIFRFLVKPCRKETLEWAIDSAIEQYQLVIAEKQLLSRTLKGAIEVLTEVLSMVNPIAFSRTSRIQNYVRQLAVVLKLSESWQYELAALLSQIGCIGVPEEVLSRYYRQEMVTEAEHKMIRNHPQLGRALLDKIPRLSLVAEMVAKQGLNFTDLALPGHTLPKDIPQIGGLMLRAVVDFDTYLAQGRSRDQAIEDMKVHRAAYHPLMLNALAKLQVASPGDQSYAVRIRDLEDGMTLAEAIRTGAGILVAAKGQQVTQSMRTVLQNYADRAEIENSVQVVLSAKAEAVTEEVVYESPDIF